MSLADKIMGREVSEVKARDYIADHYKAGVELLYRYGYFTSKQAKNVPFTDKDVTIAKSTIEGMNFIIEDLGSGYDGMGLRKRNVVSGVAEVLEGYIENLKAAVNEAAKESVSGLWRSFLNWYPLRINLDCYESQ